MAITSPDLCGNDAGVVPPARGGVSNRAPVTGLTSIASTAAQPGSPQKLLQTRWRPPSLLDFHTQILQNPEQASRDLDTSIQRAYANDSQLESMIACTQFGQTTVTGSSLSIPTGLTSVSQVTATIDQGATAHNFTISASPSQQPGCIDIYVWKPTAAGNNTPIACTTPVIVRWSVRGSL
jgi:hypothetical protein